MNGLTPEQEEILKSLGCDRDTIAREAVEAMSDMEKARELLLHHIHNDPALKHALKHFFADNRDAWLEARTVRSTEELEKKMSESIPHLYLAFVVTKFERQFKEGESGYAFATYQFPCVTDSPESALREALAARGTESQYANDPVLWSFVIKFPYPHTAVGFITAYDADGKEVESESGGWIPSPEKEAVRDKRCACHPDGITVGDVTGAFTLEHALLTAQHAAVSEEPLKAGGFFTASPEPESERVLVTEDGYAIIVAIDKSNHLFTGFATSDAAWDAIDEFCPISGRPVPFPGCNCGCGEEKLTEKTKAMRALGRDPEEIAAFLEKNGYTVQCNANDPPTDEPAIMVCKHVMNGAPVAHLIKPPKSLKHAGEAWCETCLAMWRLTQEHPGGDNFVLVCWPCFEKRLEKNGVLFVDTYNKTTEEFDSKFAARWESLAKNYGGRDVVCDITPDGITCRAVFTPNGEKSFKSYLTRMNNKLDRCDAARDILLNRLRGRFGKRKVAEDEFASELRSLQTDGILELKYIDTWVEGYQCSIIVTKDFAKFAAKLPKDADAVAAWRERLARRQAASVEKTKTYREAHSVAKVS